MFNLPFPYNYYGTEINDIYGIIKILHLFAISVSANIIKKYHPSWLRQYKDSNYPPLNDQGYFITQRHYAFDYIKLLKLFAELQSYSEKIYSLNFVSNYNNHIFKAVVIDTTAIKFYSNKINASFPLNGKKSFVSLLSVFDNVDKV